jgi:hypothetical protein
MPATRCPTCNRDPDRMNSEWSECSHVDCPTRRHNSSEGPVRGYRKTERKPDPLHKQFDHPDAP